MGRLIIASTDGEDCSICCTDSVLALSSSIPRELAADMIPSSDKFAMAPIVNKLSELMTYDQT